VGKNKSRIKTDSPKNTATKKNQQKNKYTGKRPQIVWRGRKSIYQIQAAVAMEQSQMR